MNISTETIGRLLASGRGYAQYGVGFATSLGLLSAANSKGLIDGLSDVYNGLTLAIHGVTSIWTIGLVVTAPLVSVALAAWSSHTAKTSIQAAAVKAAIIDPNTPINHDIKIAVLDAATEVKKL